MSDQGKRTRFRCPAAAESEQAFLRAQGREFQVRLLNQSAEGFAIAVPPTAPTFSAGCRLELRTHRAWSEVEVIRREEHEGEEVLGLKLVGDRLDPRDRIRSRLTLWTPRQRNTGYAKQSGPLLTLTACGIVAFWAYVAFVTFG